MRRRWTAVGAGIVLWVPGWAHAGVAGISGEDPGCPFATVQEAIDAAAFLTTVYVAEGNHFLTDELVIDKDLTVATGNADCTAEDPSVTAQIVGNEAGGKRVLRVEGSLNNVVLRNLSLMHGAPADADGGILWVNAEELTLDGVVMSSGQANNGGCMYVGGTTTVRIQNGSRLWTTCTASDPGGPGGSGGGVYANEGTTIYVYDSVLEGGASVGGVFWLSGSTLYLYSGAVVQQGDAVHGGGIYARSSSIVMDEGAIVQDCRAAAGDGGGINLAWDSTLEVRYSNIIRNSAVVDGGGISCSDSTVKLVGDTHIGEPGNGNDADEFGGGLFGYHCTITVDGSPLDFGVQLREAPPNGGVRIEGNSAFNSAPWPSGGGGGIFLDSASTLDAERLVVHNNHVGLPYSPRRGEGGGLYLDGPEYGQTVEATLIDSVIAGNSARSGGGAFVRSGTLLQLASSHNSAEGPCIADGPTESRVCTEVLDNEAVDGSRGAGVRVEDGGTFTAFATALRHNRVVTSSGLDAAALWVEPGAAATLNASLVSDNRGATNSIVVEDGGELVTKQSTFADTGRPVRYLSGALGSFYRNNAWDHLSPTSPALVVDDSLAGGCNVGKGFTGLTGTNLDDTDPLFLDPAGEDYHIDNTSPSFNRCGQGSPYDLDGVPRPQCGPSYDAGAYEVTLCL